MYAAQNLTLFRDCSNGPKQANCLFCFNQSILGNIEIKTSEFGVGINQQHALIGNCCPNQKGSIVSEFHNICYRFQRQCPPLILTFILGSIISEYKSSDA